MRWPPAAVESDDGYQLPRTVAASVAYITISAAADSRRSVVAPATHASPPITNHRVHDRFFIEPPSRVRTPTLASAHGSPAERYRKQPFGQADHAFTWIDLASNERSEP